MPKRTRPETGTIYERPVKRRLLSEQKLFDPPRRSLRLQGQQKCVRKEPLSNYPPPQKTRAANNTRKKGKKERAWLKEEDDQPEAHVLGKAELKEPDLKPGKAPGWVTHWVLKDAQLPGAISSMPLRSLSRGSSSKRTRSESTSGSELRQRMESHGINMHDDNRMSTAGRRLCDQLLTGDIEPVGYPVYPAEQRHEVWRDTKDASEAIIQRDLLPTLVPSIANLRRCGRLFLKHFGEEINAEWTRAASLGGKRPKPDYVVALVSSAFDLETWAKLKNYANSERCMLVSPDICYPLLIAECKRASVSVTEAERQTIHAAAIAVKQQVQLLWAAYGESHPEVARIDGYPLVFTVSFSHDSISLWAHYAIMPTADRQLQLCRSKISAFVLSDDNENLANTFVENVYRVCGSVHLERILNAAKLLPEPASLTASFREDQEETALRDSGDNAKIWRLYEQSKADNKAQLEQLRADNKAQLEQSKADNKAQLEQIKADNKAQLEQLRADNKAQLEQLRTDNKAQLEQNKALMDKKDQEMEEMNRRYEKMEEDSRQRSAEHAASMAKLIDTLASRK